MYRIILKKGENIVHSDLIYSVQTREKENIPEKEKNYFSEVPSNHLATTGRALSARPPGIPWQVALCVI